MCTGKYLLQLSVELFEVGLLVQQMGQLRLPSGAIHIHGTIILVANNVGLCTKHVECIVYYNVVYYVDVYV